MPNTSETIEATGNLGRLLVDRGRFDEAQQTLRDRPRSRAARRILSRTSTLPTCSPDLGPTRYSQRKQTRKAETALARSAADIVVNPSSGQRLYGRCPDDTRPHAAGIEPGRRTRKTTLRKRARRVVEGIRHRQSLGPDWRGHFSDAHGPCRDDSRKPNPRWLETYPLLLRASDGRSSLRRPVRRWIEELYRSDRPAAAGAGLLSAGRSSGARRALLHSPIVRLACAATIAQNSRLARQPANNELKTPGRASMRILIADDASSLPASVQDMFGRAPVGRCGRGKKTPERRERDHCLERRGCAGRGGGTGKEHRRRYG